MDDTEELEIEVPQPDLVAQRDQLQQQINTLLKELPNQFPLPPAGAAEESPTDDEQSQRRLHLTQSFDECRHTAPGPATAEPSAPRNGAIPTTGPPPAGTHSGKCRSQKHQPLPVWEADR